MHMRRLVLLALIATAAQLHATARCPGTTLQTLTVDSGVPFQLPVTARTGAAQYYVQSTKFFQQLPNETWLILGNAPYDLVSAANPLRITEMASATWPNTSSESVYYVVTAVNSSDAQFVPCAQDVIVTVLTDALLSQDSTRMVVPVAGSVKGAFNSTFRTRLVLEDRWNAPSDPLTGRIVFHRTGTTASLTDPSITYSINPGASIVYDDIMSTLHAADGVGTLDILPDPSQFGFYPSPAVRAQIISVAPDGGAYGADLPAVTMTGPYYGAVWASTFAPKILIAETTQKRYALGVRTLSDSVTLTVHLVDATGTEHASKTRTFAAEYHEQVSLADWFGDQVHAGDSLVFEARRNSNPALAGGAIVYLAETDNKTNDVSIVVPQRDPFMVTPPIVSCHAGCSFLTF